MHNAKPRPADGSYYAIGRQVWRAPVETMQGDGLMSFTIGYRLCVLDDDVPVRMADTIAAALNAQGGGKQ